jgi:hypothetical protein
MDRAMSTSLTPPPDLGERGRGERAILKKDVDMALRHGAAESPRIVYNRYTEEKSVLRLGKEMSHYLLHQHESISGFI